MPDWPFLSQRELVTIHPGSPESIGPQLTAWNVGVGASFGAGGGGALWPVDNLGIYIPFVLDQSITVAQLWWLNGSSPSGNIDAGIYSEGGARLIHTGSTAQNGSQVLQVVDTADTRMGPGRFYLAMAATTVSRFARGSFVSKGCNFMGVLQDASAALPLPATANFATLASQYIPMFGLTGKALI